MLRVGLTGGLGSGKSTAAAMFRQHGITLLQADTIARELMQPGHPVYRAIAEHFGPSVLRPDGTLDRVRLAAMAFGEGRLIELTRIVHPPTVAEQERQMQEIFARDRRAIVMIESALIFEAGESGTVPEWRKRFDRIVLVVAPDDLKIRRFLARTLPPGATAEQRAETERDARARLSAQLSDAMKIPCSDFIIENSGALDATKRQVDWIAAELRIAAGV
jgi:dephospho-CoA kinase